MFTTDAFITALDKILIGICRKLQLSQTQYNLAQTHYKAVGTWLALPESPLAPYSPIIYPQGSLPLGTTVKPLKQQEYDLDFICEFDWNWQYINPMILLNLVESRIEAHKTYASMMGTNDRCIRLNYAHEFHMDIVPACSHRERGNGFIKVPDRKSKNDWKDSNPKEYINWFEQQANKSLIYADTNIEPLAIPESLEEKPTLKCVVQLFKRWRDIAFEDTADLAPASIVLTTLCATHYQGQASVSNAMTGILKGIVQSIVKNNGSRLKLENPANPSENLSRRWEQNPKAYNSFVWSIKEFYSKWNQLNQTQGLHNISELLKDLFGESPTKESIQDQAESYGQKRMAGDLGVLPQSATLTILPQKSATPIRTNTFYGQ